MRKCILIVILLLSNFFNAEVEAQDIYGEVFGGGNFLQTKKRDDIKPKYSLGYILGGSIGYRTCYGLSLEVECAYRKNSFHKVHFFDRSFSRDGHFRSFSVMGNGILEVPLIWFPLYIGGGIGYDFQQIHPRDLFSVKEDRQHFAWQLIAGLNYPIIPFLLDVVLEYKFHQGGFRYINCHSLAFILNYEFDF